MDAARSPNNLKLGDGANEKLHPLRELVRQLPIETCRPPHYTTLYRWATHGLVVEGRRYCLETLMIGSVRYSNLAALEDFFRRVTEARQSRFRAERPTRAPRRKRSMPRAEDSLGAGGHAASLDSTSFEDVDPFQ